MPCFVFTALYAQRVWTPLWKQVYRSEEETARGGGDRAEVCPPPINCTSSAYAS